MGTNTPTPLGLHSAEIKTRIWYARGFINVKHLIDGHPGTLLAYKPHQPEYAIYAAALKVAGHWPVGAIEPTT